MIYSALKTRVQGKIINIHNEIGSVSALTNQIAYLEKSKLKCVDSVIDKSNLRFEICFIIWRKTILFLTSMLYFAIYPFKRIVSFH